MGDTGNDGALGKSKVADGFIEVSERSGLNAQSILPQVDSVHIVAQNRIFVHFLFQFYSKILFLKFTPEFIDQVIFRYPVGKYIVL